MSLPRPGPSPRPGRCWPSAEAATVWNRPPRGAAGSKQSAVPDRGWIGHGALSGPSRPGGGQAAGAFMAARLESSRRKYLLVRYATSVRFFAFNFFMMLRT
ncbi:hypothetical protein JHFBIEKO_4132 [Methylobacterium mesophilicum]|nr:hypothetical protein JHFBIEKO_4132 [Methylobacterium mesophilicum]